MPHEIKINIASKKLLDDLQRMASLATLPLENFIAQVIESSVADFRRAQIPVDFLSRDYLRKERAAPNPAPKYRFGPSKLNAVAAQRVLFLLGQDIGVAEVAKRANCSTTTVRRIQNNHATASHTACPRGGRTGVDWDERVRASEKKIQGIGP